MPGRGQRLRINPVQIADGAIASGRVHPRARDQWLVELAADGRRGAQAVARLMALARTARHRRGRLRQPPAAERRAGLGLDVPDG